MEETIECTWQDLVSRGKAGGNIPSRWLNEINAYREEGNTQRYIPVFRNDVLQWACEYTAEEIQEWGYATVGYYHIWHDATKLVLNGEALEANSEFNMMGRYFPYVAAQIVKQTKQPKKSSGGSETSQTYDEAAKVWGIPRKKNMSSTAALFYLLYTRGVIRKEKKAADELSYFVATIAPVIKDYLDMVAGGEVRHMINRALPFKRGVGHAPKEVEEEGFASKNIKQTGEGIIYLCDGSGRDLTGTAIGGRDRAFAWINWYQLRKEYGIVALDWCIMAHCTVQSGGYGGPLWANCASLVRKRELGQCTDVFLVDQALSLQHNGGPIFNKLWDVSRITEVLDIAYRGEIDKLEAFLEPEHKAIYRRASYGVTAYDGVKHGDRFETHEKSLDDHTKSSVMGIKDLEDMFSLVNG